MYQHKQIRNVAAFISIPQLEKPISQYIARKSQSLSSCEYNYCTIKPIRHNLFEILQAIQVPEQEYTTCGAAHYRTEHIFHILPKQNMRHPSKCQKCIPEPLVVKTTSNCIQSLYLVTLHMHGFFEKKNILFESFVFFMVLLFQLSELITVISLSRLTIFSSCNPFFVTYRLSFEAAFYFFNFILVFIWIICAWFARVNFLFHLIFSSFLKLIKFFFPFLVQFLDFLIFSTILSFYSIIVITYLCCMLISFRFCYNIFYNFIVLFFILSSLILLIGSKSSFRI